MLNPSEIDKAVERYKRERDRYRKLTDFVKTKCKDIIDDNAIRAYVQGRAKELERFRKKLQNEEKSGGYENVDDVFEEMSDLSGVRVVTYVESDRNDVVEQIKKRFSGDGENGEVVVDEKDKHDEDSTNFYRATHCRVGLTEDETQGRNANLEETYCEVQVCSLLAHVWNEIEHDLGYKTLTGPLSETEKKHLEALGHLTKCGDNLVNQLLKANSERVSEENQDFVDVHDFVYRMRDHFSNLDNFGDNSKQLFQEVQHRGLTTEEEITQKILTDDYESRAESLYEVLSSYLEQNDDDVVELDDDSSDMLLLLYLEKYCDEVIEENPTGYATGRPKRFVSIANRFKKAIEEQDDAQQANQDAHTPNPEPTH